MKTQTTNNPNAAAVTGHSVFDSKDVKKFLLESNKIEQVTSKEALNDAIKAWEFTLDKKIMTPSVVLCIHDLLIKNIEPDIAGRWRDCPVWIGGRVCHFVSEALIEDEITSICNKINKSIKDGNDNSKALHVEFEHKHPFIDGNGRTGRIVYNWHRMKLGLPIHIIKADWPKQKGEQAEYYSWFHGG